MPTVLFLCTGNYYRSRFAEHYFNHLAAASRLDWHATSKGLATEKGFYNVGPIARHTVEALERLGVRFETEHRNPMACLERDLESADLVVALKEAEHRPLMRERFPAYEERVKYWHVHDLDKATADVALAEIETLVRELARRLTRPD